MVNFKKIRSAALSGVIAASSLAGSFAAAAPSLNASAANDDYARLLQYSLYFYDANMCGEIGSKCAISWRGNCHTSDEVKGGFHDAGDHAMFGLPQGFTASVLGWSYYEFKDAYVATGQADHYKVIMDHFCDFFKASTKLSGDSVSNFLYQKGDGNEDHGYWGPPEKQGSRKMFWTSSSASDIAADYAAALALNYINFGNAEDLKYAEALYNFSCQHNKCESNGPSGFYLANDCTPQDEQANAAGWLYIATKNEKYKSDCASKQTQYLGWCDGWDNRGLGAACVYATITNDWAKVNGYLGSLCNGSNYLCMDDWGSARLNCSVQFTALVASKHGANYGSWCQGQMDYILGNNPFNTCLVTGFASNSAKNTHHRAASGYDGYNPPDGMNEGTTTYHPTKGHVLIGALAGGPDKGGQYSDVMNDYKTNEVAIDYNSGLVASAAGLYSMYKTGKVSTSIEGVTKIYNGGDEPTPPTTTQTPPQTTQGGNPPQTTQGGQQTTPPTQTTPSQGNDKVLTASDMTVGQETGDDGATNNYAEFSPQGAKSATLYLTVKSNDTEVSGGFGTWTGEWVQEDFSGVKVGADKTVAIDYTIPSKVGSTVKAMVWWPHGDDVVIDKVVLHMDGSSAPATTQAPTTQPPATTKATTTTQPQQGGNSGNGKIGDANDDGEVTMADAAAILQYLGNGEKYKIEGAALDNADCCNKGDGITPKDALAIQRYKAGIINSLPATF